MALNFPNNPGIGSVFTDSTSGFSYEWDGTVWKSYASASSSNIKILDDISGLFDGVTSQFAITSSSVSITPASPQQLRIVLGGVVQSPGVDYTVLSSNITFTTPPSSGLSFSGVSLGPAVPTSYANDGNIYIRRTYAGAGTTGPFDFSETYTVGYLDVYRNGVRLRSGTDFTATSGTNFYLTDAASVDDELEAIGYTVTALVQASSVVNNLNVIGIGTLANLRVTGVSTFGTSSTAVIDSNGNITAGIVTATSFVGNLTGDITGNSTGLSGTPDITVGNVTGTAVTFTDLTVTGTQTIINTTSLEIADKTVGIASTTAASNTTADGAGIVVYGGTDGDKSITWDNTSQNWVIVGGGLSVTDYEGNFILDSYLFN